MAAREYWAVRAPMLAWRRQPDGCVTSLRRTGLGSRHRVFRAQQGICNYSAHVIAGHETLDLPPIRPIVDTEALAGIGSFKAIRSVVAA